MYGSRGLLDRGSCAAPSGSTKIEHRTRRERPREGAYDLVLARCRRYVVQRPRNSSRSEPLVLRGATGHLDDCASRSCAASTWAVMSAV